MSAIEENGAITRGPAPISGISVPGRVAEGCDLVHALDYVVFLQVMCNLAAGVKFTPQTVWKQLQARGIRSAKNASVLVGRDAVYESFARLIEAGYMRRVELPNEKHPGRKGPIAYQAFDNPAWNPDWQVQQAGSDPLQSAGEEPQVGMLPGTPDPVKAEVEETAGRNASRNAGSGNAGSGVPGSGSSRVPAGQNASGVPGSIEPSPPHPPEEEVETSSPYPHKHAAAPRRDRQQKPDVPADAITAATKFLMKLPGSWAAGVKTAESLAPWLVRNAELTGWDLDMQLRMYLVRPEPSKKPITSYAGALGYRIKNMQPRDAVLEAAAAAKQESEAPKAESASGMPDWCGECNGGERPLLPYMRIVPSTDPDDDSVTRCPRCHPSVARRTA